MQDPCEMKLKRGPWFLLGPGRGAVPTVTHEDSRIGVCQIGREQRGRRCGSGCFIRAVIDCAGYDTEYSVTCYISDAKNGTVMRNRNV